MTEGERRCERRRRRFLTTTTGVAACACTRRRRFRRLWQRTITRSPGRSEGASARRRSRSRPQARDTTRATVASNLPPLDAPRRAKRRRRDGAEGERSWLRTAMGATIAASRDEPTYLKALIARGAARLGGGGGGGGGGRGGRRWPRASPPSRASSLRVVCFTRAPRPRPPRCRRGERRQQRAHRRQGDLAAGVKELAAADQRHIATNASDRRPHRQRLGAAEGDKGKLPTRAPAPGLSCTSFSNTTSFAVVSPTAASTTRAASRRPWTRHSQERSTARDSEAPRWCSRASAGGRDGQGRAQVEDLELAYAELRDARCSRARGGRRRRATRSAPGARSRDAAGGRRRPTNEAAAPLSRACSRRRRKFFRGPIEDDSGDGPRAGDAVEPCRRERGSASGRRAASWAQPPRLASSTRTRSSRNAGECGTSCGSGDGEVAAPPTKYACGALMTPGLDSVGFDRHRTRGCVADRSTSCSEKEQARTVAAFSLARRGDLEAARTSSPASGRPPSTRSWPGCASRTSSPSARRP